MEPRHNLMLLDERGDPFSPHVEAALVRLVPRLRREFPLIRDQSSLTDLLEEAGRRIATRERRSGPIENLHGYAWVTLRSVATSWMRGGSGRLAQNTLGSEDSETALDATSASYGAPEQIERNILWREVLAQLTREERLVCTRKEMGFSSREIARLRGTSAGAVDTLLSRAKQKLQKAFGVQLRDAGQDERAGRPAQDGSEAPGRARSDFENFDDE